MTPDVSALRRRLTLAFIVVPLLVATSCATFQDASDWDDPLAKTHFVEACVGDTQVENSTTTVVELAAEDFCVCVFDDLRKVHKITWDKMLEFEQSLAKVDADNPPDVPTQVDKAVEACSRAGAAGPAAPESSDGQTTTTEDATG